MPGRGPAPKDPAARRRRNKETRVDLAATAVSSPLGPELSGQHMPQTVAWYATWRTSPMAVRFVATDWQRLQMVAVVVDAFYATGDMRCLTEIRLNESLLGATEADRARLKWDLRRDEPRGATTTEPGRPRLKVV